MNTLRQSFGTLIRNRPIVLSSMSTAALSSSSTVSILPHSPKIYSLSEVSGCRPKTLLTFFNSQQNTLGKRFLACDASANPEVKERFDKLVKNNKVVVFMKGVPDEPRCGFSNAVVQILRMHGVTNYDSHDVLSDETIRQGIKDYTNWPTIPQVFIDGEFVGGCDILIEMHKNGELVEQLSKVGIKSALLKDDGGNSK